MLYPPLLGAGAFLPFLLPSVSAMASQPSGQPPPSAFAAAIACDSCDVRYVAKMELPNSGVEAWSAKLWNRQTGDWKAVTLLGDGLTPADPGSLINAERVSKNEKFGKLTPRLHSSLSSLTDTDTVDVFIRTSANIEIPPRGTFQNIRGAGASALVAYKATATAEFSATASPIASWLQARGITNYEGGTNSPIMTARLTKPQIGQLATLDQVARIGHLVAPQPLSTTWYQSINAQQALVLSPGGATSITACMVDEACPPNQTYLKISDCKVLDAFSEHSQAVAGIISNTYGNSTSMTNGRVISSSPHYGASTSTTFVFEYCKDEWEFGGDRFPVVNVSLKFQDYTDGPIPANQPDMEYVNQYVDYLSLLPPYPLYVMAAGNETGKPNVPVPYVDNKSFNALVVGASNDMGTPWLYDDAIADFSNYVNPRGTHSDYELPHLVAPGVGIYSADMVDVYSTENSLRLPLDGTSFSAPQVSGVAMLVYNTDPATYENWPEMLKTTILATTSRTIDGAKFVSLSDSFTSEGQVVRSDRRDGIGLLDAAAAVQLADSSNYRAPNSPAAARGRYRGEVDTSADYLPEVWNVVAEKTGRMKVVLAWDSNPSCTYASYSIGNKQVWGDYCEYDIVDLDLDLDVTWAGNSYAYACYSITHDGTWEACDFPVNAGDSFTIRIRNMGYSTSRNYYSIAWSNHDDYYRIPPGAVPFSPRAWLVVLGALLLAVGHLRIRRRQMVQSYLLVIVGLAIGLLATSCGDDSRQLPEDASIAGMPDANVAEDAGATAQSEASAGADNPGIDADPCGKFIGGPEKIASTPRANYIAELAALKIDGTFIASQGTYDRIVADLNTIPGVTKAIGDYEARHPRFGYPYLYSLPFKPRGFTSGMGISITLDSNAFANASAGTYRAWDCLNSYYGLREITVEGGSTPPLVTVAVKGIYDTNQLAGLYGQLPGVIMASGLPIPDNTMVPEYSDSYLYAGRTGATYQYALFSEVVPCSGTAPGSCTSYKCYQTSAPGVASETGHWYYPSDPNSEQSEDCRTIYRGLCLEYNPLQPSFCSQ